MIALASWVAWYAEYPEEGSIVVRASTQERALASAARQLGIDAEDAEEEICLRTFTDEDRRARRNAHAALRREAAAQRAPAGDGVPDPDPLPMHVWYAVFDTGLGRYRCAWCGRFRIKEDFRGAPTSVRIPGGIVDYAAACRSCRGGDATPVSESAPS